MENKNSYLEEVQMIGLRIAYFRKMRKMTQTELARAVNINKSYLSHIESGSSNKIISLPLLIMIAKALDVELPILVDIHELEDSNRDMRRQFNEMRDLFNEMKAFNDELDSMMATMDLIKLPAPEQK